MEPEWAEEKAEPVKEEECVDEDVSHALSDELVSINIRSLRQLQAASNTTSLVFTTQNS